MCIPILKYFFYYFLVKKDIDTEWNKLEKKSDICKECYKYSNTITYKDELCYRCFENWFYDDK